MAAVDEQYQEASVVHEDSQEVCGVCIFLAESELEETE